MTEQEIRKKYQRDDETDLRGANAGAIDNLIGMLEIHKNSSDEYVRNIAEHFGEFEKLAPNFVIFESQKSDECFYMHSFSAFQIGKDTESLISSHEFGHAVIGVTSKTKVPEGYDGVIARAKAHALAPENREYFKQYITYLSQKDNEDRTQAEKGPVSDIISSVFQQEGFRIGSYDNECWLPAYHLREYYFDEEKGEVKVDKVYDEDFSNFYSLKANNCEKEIETLRNLFGDELIEVLSSEILKSAVILERVASKDQKESVLNEMESIKGVITGTTQEDIRSISEPEKENYKDEGERE